MFQCHSKREFALGDAFYEAVHTGKQIIGKQGFEPEVGVEARVFVFRFGQPADDQHGNRRRELANFADELGAVHPGHDVIGDDEIDGSRELIVAELLESALRVERSDDEVARPLEDRLACRCLNGIVIYQENCCRHSFLLPILMFMVTTTSVGMMPSPPKQPR